MCAFTFVNSFLFHHPSAYPRTRTHTHSLSFLNSLSLFFFLSLSISHVPVIEKCMYL